MAVDKLVDSTQLDACCTAEANAIRAKTGSSAQISYDWANSKGFADAIAAISGGSSGLTQLASGSYTKSDTANGISIPVTYTGTPKLISICADTPVSDTGQVVAVIRFIDTLNTSIAACFPDGFAAARQRTSANVESVVHYTETNFTVSSSQLTASNISSTYKWRQNTYSWYIYG